MFFCLEGKLDVEAKMRQVLLGQTSLLCLCSCDSTCTVDVQSLRVYFGRSRERASERVFILGAVERELVNPGADLCIF